MNDNSEKPNPFPYEDPNDLNSAWVESFMARNKASAELQLINPSAPTELETSQLQQGISQESARALGFNSLKKSVSVVASAAIKTPFVIASAYKNMLRNNRNN